MNVGFNSLWEATRAFGVVVDNVGVVVFATPSATTILGESPMGHLWIRFYDTDKMVVHAASDSYPVRIRTESHEHGTSYWVEDATHERIFELAVNKAEEARDDLRQLEYAVSHDLMEPLRGISASLTAMDKLYGPGIPDEALELVHHAIYSTRSMQKLLTDFLNYVRLDTTDMRRHTKPVDLNVIIRDVLQSLRLLVAEAHATVAYKDLPTVDGDWRMLYQVFSNLISNALKFKSPDRPCVIEVTSIRVNDRWHIQVTDNGVGMPADRISTIFTPFIRLHKSIPGSGIGLAIVKRCVEHHSGTILVESSLGVGTTFRLSLPTKCGTEAENPVD